MKIGLAVIARMGSSRLPGKHLREALTDGTSFFRVLVERLKTLGLPIVLATGTDSKDDQLVKICDGEIGTYRGYDNNVPMRILGACQSQNWDAIIPIDGDDILISLDAIDDVYAELLVGEAYVATSGLPFGMNASGFSLSALIDATKNYSDGKLETGWGRIFSNPPKIIKNMLDGSQPDLRFSLDYHEDMIFFRELLKIMQRPYDADVATIVSLVKENNLQKINSNVVAEYWKNFEIERNKEISNWKKP